MSTSYDIDREATDLLFRAANNLQAYCEETNGDMNDSLAMEIWAWLDARKPAQTDLD